MGRLVKAEPGDGAQNQSAISGALLDYRTLTSTKFETMFNAAQKMARDSLSIASASGRAESSAAPPPVVYDTIIHEMVAKLKLLRHPTLFWESARKEPPEGLSVGEGLSWSLFCSTALNVTAIIVHTSGTERAGKTYHYVHTPDRQRLLEVKIHKQSYILHNYHLILKSPDAMSLAKMVDLTNFEKELQSESEAMALGGSTENRLQESDSSEPGSDTEEEEPIQIAPEQFAIPEGFVLLDRPDELDLSIVGYYILYKWAAGKATARCPNPDPGGWYLGQLMRRFDLSTPTLYRRYNYDVAYSDGKFPQKLDLDRFLDESSHHLADSTSTPAVRLTSSELNVRGLHTGCVHASSKPTCCTDGTLGRDRGFYSSNIHREIIPSQSQYRTRPLCSGSEKPAVYRLYHT